MVAQEKNESGDQEIRSQEFFWIHHLGTMNVFTKWWTNQHTIRLTLPFIKAASMAKKC